MARPNPQPQPAVPVQPAQLPEPTNPIIEYLRNILGAQFYRPHEDVPNQYGYYAGLANLPREKGGSEAGQFASSGAGGSSSALAPAPKDRQEWPEHMEK